MSEEDTDNVPQLEEALGGRMSFSNLLDTEIQLLEALKARIAQLEAAIERMSASRIHQELRRAGIKYLVPHDSWVFLDEGAERSLGALLLKLFEYDETYRLIIEHYTNKGGDELAEFTAWADEQAIFFDENTTTDTTAIVDGPGLKPPVHQRELHPDDTAPPAPLPMPNDNNILSFGLQPTVSDRDEEYSRRGIGYAEDEPRTKPPTGAPDA